VALPFFGVPAIVISASDDAAIRERARQLLDSWTNGRPSLLFFIAWIWRLPLDLLLVLDIKRMSERK
jgi:hypothetical protein